MSISRKFQRSKSKYTLSQKIISAVTAAGFIMQPIVGFAQAITKADDAFKNTIINKGNGVTDIWADRVVGNSAVNVFKDFQLDANNIANMYFNELNRKEADASNLVNFVNSRIDINGTVNAVKDNKIGGNLFFLSKDGMAVGKSGVINTGSLYVMTPTKDYIKNMKVVAGTADAATAEKELNAITNITKDVNAWQAIPVNTSGTITVLGKVNATNEVQMRAAKIAVGKNNTESAIGDVAANDIVKDAFIKTGITDFSNIVNIAGTDGNGGVDAGLTGDALTATQTGSGDIVLSAYVDGANKTNELGELPVVGTTLETIGATIENTFEEQEFDASVDVYGTVETTGEKGAININATAINSNADYDGTIKDYKLNNNNNVAQLAKVKADVNIGGTVKAVDDITVKAEAVNRYIDNSGGFINGLKLAISSGTPLTGDAAYSVLGTEANVNITSAGSVESTRGNVDIDAKAETLAASAVSTLGLKFKTAGGTTGANVPAVAVVYTDVDNKANVTVAGNVKAAQNISQNISIDADADMKVEAENKMSLMGKMANQFVIGVTVANADNGAEVIINGTGKEIAAGNNLNVNADATSDFTSRTSIKAPEASAMAVAVNVAEFNSNANVNIDTDLSAGNDLNVKADNIITDDNVNAESTIGSGKYMSAASQIVTGHVEQKKGEVKEWIGTLAGKISAKLQGKLSGSDDADIPSLQLSEIFKAGATVNYSGQTHGSNVTIGENTTLNAGKKMDIEALTKIEDAHITATGTTASYNDAYPAEATLNAAVLVNNMDNSSSVVIKDAVTDEQGTEHKATLSADDGVDINASTRFEYNRIANMIQEVKDAAKQIASAVDDLDGSIKKDFKGFINTLNEQIGAWERAFKTADETFATSDSGVLAISKAATAGLQVLTALNNLNTMMDGNEGGQVAADVKATIQGASDILTGALAFADPNSYGNFAAASASKGSSGDTGAIAGHHPSAINGAGTVMVNNVDSVSKVEVGSNSVIASNGKVSLNAENYMKDVSLGGLNTVPLTNSGGGTAASIGATVNYSDFNTDTIVAVNDGANISGGDINIAGSNEIDHVSVAGSAGMGPSDETESKGIVLNGMLSFVDGSSDILTVVDDGAKLTANAQKQYTETVINEETGEETEETKTSEGSISISGHNDTNIVNVAAGLNLGSGSGAVGVGLAYNDFAVKNIAGVADVAEQIEGLYGTGTGDVTFANKYNKDAAEDNEGGISAYGFDVDAATEGSIQSVSVAASASKNDDTGEVSFFGKIKGGISNVEKDLLGSGGKLDTVTGKIFGTESGKANDFFNMGSKTHGTNGGGIKIEGGTSGKGGFMPSFSIAGSGSVSLNVLNNATEAIVDNAKISMNDGNINVTARDALYAGAYSGAAALQWKSGGSSSDKAVGFAGAAGVNDIDNVVKAVVKESTIENAGEFNTMALSGGEQLALGLGLAVEKTGSTSGYSGNAAVSVNLIDHDVEALLENNKVTNTDDVNVSAYARDIENTGGGSLGAGQQKVGVGATVGVAMLNNNITAGIKGGEYKNVGNVDVEALNALQNITVGIAAGLTLPSSGSGASAVVEGAGVYNEVHNTTNAFITGTENGNDVDNIVISTVDGGSVNVTAQDVAVVKTYEDILTDGLADGKQEIANRMGKDFDITGKTELDGVKMDDAETELNKNKQDTETKESVKLDKNTGSSIITVAGGLAATTGKGAGGAAVAITDIENTYTADVKYADITADELDVDAGSNSNIVTVAGGIAAANKGSGVGSVSWNDVINTANVNIENSHIHTQQTTATAANQAQIVSVGGQISGAGKAAVGATLSYVGLDNTTKVNISTTEFDERTDGGTSVTAEANNTSDSYNIGAGVSAAGEAAVSGTVVVTQTKGTAGAVMDGAKINNAKEIIAHASDDTDILSVIGTVSAAGTASVGAGVAYTEIGSTSTDEVDAQQTVAAIENTDITTAASASGSTVSAQATDSSKVINVAVGIGGAGTAAVQGASATSLINKTTSAEITNTNIDKDLANSENANVTIDAQNNSEITSSADVASVAGTAGVGAGVAVNRIVQNTQAALNGGTMNVNNLIVSADGTPRIENIGIGVGAGGTAGVTGSVAVNMIANNVTAHIGNGANIVADGSVGVVATSDEQIANYAGVLGGGGTAGVGVSVSVNQINGTTSATVGDETVGNEDKETNVTALGNGAGLKTDTNINKDTINNALIDDSTVAIGKHIERKEEGETRSGLIVDASSTRDMKSFLVTAGVAGNAGIAGTVNVNMIKGATNAGVANTTINSGSASKADAGNVFVNAGDYTNMSGFVGSLGVGIEGAGVGLASDTNTVERNVTAIVSGSNVNATNKFEIDAESMQGISSYSLGGGIAGMGAGVAGVVTVAELENTTKAALQNSKVNANTVIVNANHKGIVNAGNTGVGVGVVGAGIGLSVGVLKDNSETYAEVSGDNKAEDTITAAGNVKIAATNTAVAKPVIYSTGAGGFAGVAGATSINNLNSKVVTNIKDVAISSTGESISGIAQNNFEVDASMGSFAGAAVGAGAGVTVNTIGSTVQTNVSNSDLEAAKDVILTAEEIRNIKQLSTNAAIGGVAAGVNIAITNVGQKVENTVDGDETVSNAADKIDEANNFYVDKNGKNYGSDLTSGANDALETAGIGSITLDVDAGDGSTKDEAGKIVPIISQISVNITNSDIDAGGTVKANAAESGNINMTLGSGAAGAIAGNVGVGILNVHRNVGVNINGGSLNADNKVDIGTDITGSANLEIYQGSVGVIGATVAVGEVNTTGSSDITIGGTKIAAKNVSIIAQDNAKTVLKALGVSGGGLAGIGALAADAANNSDISVNITGSTITSTAEKSNDKDGNTVYDGGNIEIITNKANVVTAQAVNTAGGMVGDAGMGATVSDNGSSVVNLNGNAMHADVNIDASAKTVSTLTADILNGAAGSFAAGAVSAAMVNAGSENDRMITAVNIGNGNTFAAQNTNFTADSDIIESVDMDAFSVSGAYSVEGNGTDLAAYTAVSVTADANNTYEGTADSENSNVKFEAENTVVQAADTSGISAAGGFATGTNIGNTTSNLKTKVDIKGSSADSNINNLTANANSYADIDNNVNGDGGAIADVSPYAAKVNNNYTADTDVVIGGTWNTAGSFDAQAVNGMDIDLKSDAVRAAVVGGSGTWLDNTINNAANVIVNGASITTGGAQSYIAQNNVDYAGEIAGSGYGGLNVNATDYSDDLDFTAGVNITGSTLHGTGDDASITAFASTQGDIIAKNSLKSAGVIPVALAFSDYDIDYNNSVNVSGSSLTTDKADADITLAATDDTVVKLETIADTQGGAVGAASAKADNAFDRANRINVDSTSTLLSSNDANLYAGANISGITSSLNLQVLADAYNKTALPLVTVPSVENRMTQANQVAIGGNIESVRHVNLKAGKGDTTVTESAKEYNIYQGTTGSGSVASTTLGDTVGGETTNNFVDVTGNVTAGVHNSLNITINGTINIDKNNQNISYSDFNANAAEDWFNDDTIQKTDTTIENNLMERYNEITGLMQQYQESTNEYKSFKQEKENLLKEMLNMGMAYEDEKGNITPVNEISVPAVEVPDIVVSGGNINIDADVAKGNGNLTANSAGSVNITNNSDAYLIINDITMKDAGGQIKFNGSDIANVTSDAGNNLSKDNITTGESSGEVPSINIIGTAGIKDNIQADIGIFGDLTNTAGDITVKNNSYGITVLGNVNGRNISLIAENGNVTQTSTEGFINIGNDPVTKYQFSEKVAKAIQEYIYDQYVSSDGNYTIPAFADYNAYLTWIKENIVGDAYGISESDLTYKVDESKGIVAGGNVYINGLNVNIAGLIQSGYGDYSTTLDETAKTAVEKLDSEWQSSKESLSDNEVIGNEKYCINGGGAVYNTDTDVWDYEVKVYYNPSTGELLTDSINIGGGKIYITGNISSTGGGRIMAMDGAADINIDTSAVDRNVKINSIANNDVSGLVSITDKQKGTVTEYTNGQTRTYQIGTAAGAWQNGNSSYKYSPKDGLQYQWTGGVSGEVIKKYQYKENFLFWGLLDYDTTETFIKGLEGKVESIDDLITSTSGGEGKTDSKDSGVIVTTGGTGADFSITGSYTNTGEEKYTDIVADMKYDGVAGKIFGYGETTYTWSGTQGTASSTTTSIAADKDISIGFIGSGNKEGNINVTGNKDMLLAGNISNAEVDGKGKGSVTLTSETGSVSAIGSANINSDDVNIKAATGVDVNHAAIGDTANINVATDSGDISFVSSAGDLKIEQMITGITYKDDGTIDTDNIDASTGSVYLEAQGDILDAAKGDYTVKGQRIDLVSHTGSIGTKDKALTVLGGSELYSSDAMASSVNAQANGDIVLTQTNGNMRLGTINSENGDAVLTVNNGSFVDAHPSENNDNSSAQEKIDRWLEAGLISDQDEADESTISAEQAKKERMEALDNQANSLAYEAIYDDVIKPEVEKYQEAADAFAKDETILAAQQKLQEALLEAGNDPDAIAAANAEYQQVVDSYFDGLDYKYDDTQKKFIANNDKAAATNYVFDKYKAGAVKKYQDAAGKLAEAFATNTDLQAAKDTYLNSYKEASAAYSAEIAAAEAAGATDKEIVAIGDKYQAKYDEITNEYLAAQKKVYGDNFTEAEQQLISSYAEVDVDESNYGWSKNQLLYAIQESVLTSEPGTVQTVDTPNVTANNITLNAAEGGIGIDGEAKVIDYADLNDEANLKLLAQAKAGDLTWDELNQQVTIRQQQAITVQVKQEGGKVDVTGKDNVYLAGVQGTELNVNGITTTGDIRLQGDDGVYVDGTLTGVDLTITGGTGDIMGAGSDDYVDTNISGTLDANANGSIYISQNGDLKVLTVATNALADLKATNNILMSDVEGSQAQGYINAQTLNLAAGGNIGTDAINTNALRILNNGVVVNAKANKENGDIILAGVTGTGLDGELVLGAIEGANLDVTSAGNVSIGKDASEGETAVEGSIEVNGDASISAEDGSVTQTADSNITANAVNASATENILLNSKENSVNSFVVNGLGADNSLNGSVNIVSTAHNAENTVKVDFGKVVGEETVGLTVNGTVDVTSTGTSGLNISGGSLTTSGNNAGNVTFTSAGSITAGTSVNSAADIVMDAKGAVTNTGSLTARNNIDVTTTTGKIDLGGSVTANTGNVSIETDSGTITTTGNVTGGNDVNVTSGSGAINLGGNVEAETGLVNVTTGSGSITTTGNVSGHKDVTLESVDGNITVGGYTESEVENVTANVKGDGNIEFTGEVSASGNVQAEVTGEGDISTGSSASVSGTDITFTTNDGSITTGSNLTADANVNLNTNTGDIILGGDTTANNGNITININKEGSLKDAANTDNTLSAFSPDNDASKGNIYINLKGIGDVDLSEIYADNDARVDVADGNLTLGTINGQLVAIQLRTQDREMNVGEIIAGTQIVLTGSDMTLDQIAQRPDADGMLVITPDNAEADKPIDNFTIGDIKTNSDSGIRFDRLWVNNSDIHISEGQLWFDKLYVEDNAHFSNDEMTAAIYGKPPLRDGSDSVYWINTEENRPESSLDMWLNGTGDWMYLRFTDDHIQESNGILLTLDEYDYVYDQRFTAENHLRWQHGRYLDEDWKQAYGYGLSLHNRYGLIDYQEFTETNASADEVAVEA